MKQSSWYRELKDSEAGGSFWTRGTKVNVGIALFVVSMLLFGSIGYAGYLSYTGPDGSRAWTSTDQTFITTSNGNRYNATFAGLQAAIYSFNNTVGGKIIIPSMISCSAPINLVNGITIEGTGRNSSGFMLSPGANCSLLRNQTGKTCSNLTLNNLKLDGKCMTAGYKRRTGDSQRWNNPHLICIAGSSNIKIKDCNILNASSSGIYFYECNKTEISGCVISDSGKVWKNRMRGPTDTINWYYPWADGIFLEACNGSIISDCNINGSYAHGILIEDFHELGTRTGDNACNFVIDNCILTRCFSGLYLEDAENGSVSNIFTGYHHYNYTYGGYASSQSEPTGVHIGPDTNNVAFTNIISADNGNLSDGDDGHGYDIISGNNLTFTNCHAKNNLGCGFYNYNANDVSFIGCSSYCDGESGFYVDSGQRPVIKGCRIWYTGQTVTTDSDGINIGYCNNAVISDNGIYNSKWKGISSAGRNSLITNNVINNSVEDGIFFTVSSRAIISGNHIDTCKKGIDIYTGDECVIMGNEISFSKSVGIRFYGSENNTAIGNVIRNSNIGISENSTSNYNVIVGNNAYGCTTPINVAGTNTTWFVANAYKYGFNWGAIS